MGARGSAVFWFGNLRERNHFVDLGVDGKIILKCILKKSIWRSSAEFI
jgi:hypothetical protein